MFKRVKIENTHKEELDTVIQGNENAENLIIFVHGFGTDKGEGTHLFAEIADSLEDSYLLLRFDQSGCGKSGGPEQDYSIHKSAKDLESVVEYARRLYPVKSINILAHSMGTVITTIFNPNSINKIIFTGITNLELQNIADRLEQRILSKGGIVDKSGITTYPRTSGKVQKLGPQFWSELSEYNIKEDLTTLANKSKVTIFKPLNDQIVGNGEEFDEYKHIPNINYVELSGDHNFSNKDDRINLINNIKEHLRQ